MSDELFTQRPLPAKTDLQQILNAYFNDSELRDLCFRLHIEYEDLGGNTKSDKVRELILHAERHNRTEALLQTIYELRPHAGVSVRQEAAKRLDASDPLLAQLNSLVEQLRTYHERLREWKEMHNHLDETLNIMGACLGQIDLSANSGEIVNAVSLKLLWRPSFNRLERTIDWGVHDVRHLDKLQFGSLEPDWAYKLRSMGDGLQDFLSDFETLQRRRRVQQSQPEVRNELWETQESLLDRTRELDDYLRKLMFQADKELRKAVGELYELSRQSLWGQS